MTVGPSQAAAHLRLSSPERDADDEIGFHIAMHEGKLRRSSLPFQHEHAAASLLCPQRGQIHYFTRTNRLRSPSSSRTNRPRSSKLNLVRCSTGALG